MLIIVAGSYFMNHENATLVQKRQVLFWDHFAQVSLDGYAMSFFSYFLREKLVKSQRIEIEDRTSFM